MEAGCSTARTWSTRIWLCQAFDHYWLCTGDESFLKDKAYPYFKETAECILRWLKPGQDGKLRLPLSSSPEIHDNAAGSWLTSNSNNDLALLIYLFRTLRRMSEELNNGERQRWIGISALLPELSVDDRNVLMLSPDESLKESHRHHAHVMAVHPLGLLDYGGDKRSKDIIDATVCDLETLGSGRWIGFSFTWMAELYAIQGNGEGAAYQLKLFAENFCSKNGFHLNGDYKKRGVSAFHYRPFTLEANMCAADAIQEMLLKTSNGNVRVFPAVPEDWGRSGVSFCDLRGEKGIHISAFMKNNELRYIELWTDKNGVFGIQNRFDSDMIEIEINGRLSKISCSMCEIFNISLNRGDFCRIISVFSRNKL